MHGLSKIIFALGFGLIAVPSWGGTITVNGISNLKHPVEFVSLKLNITSRCSEDPELASAKNQQVMEQIRQIMNALISQGQIATDEVLFTQDSINVADAYDGNELLCKQQWTASRSIAIRTGYLKGIPTLKEGILRVLKNNSNQESKNLLLSLAQPNASLFPETVAALEKEAIKSAAKDASDKFKALSEVCEMKEPELVRVQAAQAVVRDYSDGNVDQGNDLGFEFQYVHQTWDFTWKFKNTVGLCGN